MTTPVQKIGSYVCRGCGLGERLDVEQLVQLAQTEGSEQASAHEMLCSTEGLATIQADIDRHELTHVMLGACSHRAKTEAFQFPTVAIARANLREGVIWSQPPAANDNEDAAAPTEKTQEMAADYVRMACAELKHMTPPTAHPARGSNKRLLVVGGGVSGMTAAVAAAEAGYAVLLVEKNELGGWAKTLHRRIPDRAPYTEPQSNDMDTLIAQVSAEDNIRLWCNATVARTSGAPGQFSVDIARQGKVIASENVGAIIQATGFTPYDANQLVEFAYDRSSDVIDQLELEALMRAAGDQPPLRPSDAQPIKQVVFIQCAGQRSTQPGHLPYCSGCCCNVSIKQAMYFKTHNPAIDTHIIYRDLRTPGQGEDFYRAAQKQGVLFSNGTVAQVEPQPQGLTVHFHDHILAQDATCHADLVVLATGQQPNSGVSGVATDTATKPVTVTASESATEPVSPSSSPAQAMVSVDSILNLTYRQGPDLPHLKHGFSDSHFICFPYETRRTGIYSCGPVRRPMDIAQAVEDATGAAMKAIQAVEGAAQGRAAHPRVGDLSYPTFRRDGCTQCKRCTVECPFGAIDEEDGYPQFNEARCRRCGTCMGACPVRVISFDNYSVDTVGQQIKAVDMPDEFDEKPRILVLACENDAYPALDMAGQNRLQYSAFVRVIPIRCLGSVNMIWLTDALNAGYDGIMLMGCKKGDDYQCHFVDGSELAHERAGKIADTLTQLQLETERVQIHEIEITDVHRVATLINDYADTIDKIGLNPFKGF